MAEWAWVVVFVIITVMTCSVALGNRASLASLPQLMVRLAHRLAYQLTRLIHPAFRPGIHFQYNIIDIATVRKRVSVAHPKRLSKRVTSKVVVSIYIPDARTSVRSEVQKAFLETEHIEHLMDAKLPDGELLKIALVCPGIVFSDPILTQVTDDHTSVSFVARPEDTSQHGVNHVKVAITDPESSYEYFSGTFDVLVADFVFDHVSQPLFSKVSAGVFGLGAIAMFVLTLLQTIDTALGITAGATAAAVSTSVYGRFLWIFRDTNSQQVAS